MRITDMTVVARRHTSTVTLHFAMPGAELVALTLGLRPERRWLEEYMQKEHFAILSLLKRPIFHLPN